MRATDEKLTQKLSLFRNLSNCEIARKKSFSWLQRDFNQWPLRRAAVLYQLSYEDPYTESRPIY